MNFLKKKLEEKVGFDLDGDGRIGGAGPSAHLEKATHVDFNRDGHIGAHQPSADGGLIGKIEKATHIDINGDGRIGGGTGHVTPRRH